ncbi:MAG TPA: malto-oligosyltrehalose trehalohydrolase [Candidatus Acidoferrales bacterium]|nr:malto-oligosyltrehalose trehalohydrolase [Candidatus Acidoferrales bacterium]
MQTAASSTMLGATVHGSNVEVRVWAPAQKKLVLRLWRKGDPNPHDFSMPRLGSADFGPADFGEIEDADTFVRTVEARSGDRYAFVIDDRPLPDPVSRLLPEGVHGPTEIVDPADFEWTDDRWRGLPLSDYVIYELHIGTFTPEGTLDAAIRRLPYLRDLGVTVVELMPVNAFPGRHNWGYDGVGLYAVQASYGGPGALRRFVNAAHEHGLAVVQDVNYNHLGNEGNYLRQFGPYFTPRHNTPWGEAVNYDDEGSKQVRAFVVENTLYWLREYHMDGLRLDAVQTIRDDSALHIVQEIAERAHDFAHEVNRNICIIAETDENDARYIRDYHVDAVWSDDFHHVVHALLTGENLGYYQDFHDPRLLVRALNEGWAFQGEMFNFWRDIRGTSPVGIPLPANVICIQNHDQVGNRALGERLTSLVPFGARKAATALLLLAPHTPLLFMGQEYDERAPFQFFTDYGDPALQKGVSEGRRREFADFDWNEVPDPQDRATFERSRLTWQNQPRNLEMLEWVRKLLLLRREYIMHGPRTCRAVWGGDKILQMDVAGEEATVRVEIAFHRYFMPEGAGWRTVLSAAQDDFATRVMLFSEPRRNS